MKHWMNVMLVVGFLTLGAAADACDDLSDPMCGPRIEEKTPEVNFCDNPSCATDYVQEINFCSDPSCG